MVALRGDGNQQQQQCMCKIGARLVVLTAAAALCLRLHQLEGHSRGLLRQVGQQHLKVRALSDPQLRPGAHKALAARSAPPPPLQISEKTISLLAVSSRHSRQTFRADEAPPRMAAS